MKRLKNKTPLKNSLTALIANGVAILLGFIAQRVFANALGPEYLGINGFFSNIISMLSVAELGIGSAIIYNLYRPMKLGDKELIKSLAGFYKKAYRVIMLAISGIGLAILPSLGLIVGDLTIDTNIYLIFSLFIIDSVASYLLAYRRSILYADRKNYLISLVHIGYLVVLNALQILLLILTQNFYLYLIVRILLRLVENYVLYQMTAKRYPYLKEQAKELPKKIKKDIFIKTKGLLFHKIGSFVILGTDNLVISCFLGITTVGFYSNYAMIIVALNTVFSQAIFALIPSVGHLLVEKDQPRNFATFRKVRQTTFLVALLTSVGLLVLATPFVKLWLGESYLLPLITLFILTINYFQQLMRASFVTFKEAAGIYHEDRFAPLVESAVNIVASIVLVQWLGLPGVFIGTILSSLVLWCFSYPKFVYKPLFGRSYRQYALEIGAYFAIFAAIITPIYLLLTA
ncbi:oligosaccharide flippase family protein [Candidatus Saccharibacteria bacterium]|nr:oligosaccharide flippase family protein [Candidatus Saccharibacteria bacterium]